MLKGILLYIALEEWGYNKHIPFRSSPSDLSSFCNAAQINPLRHRQPHNAGCSIQSLAAVCTLLLVQEMLPYTFVVSSPFRWILEKCKASFYRGRFSAGYFNIYSRKLIAGFTECI
jgi:hypothetical protein